MAKRKVTASDRQVDEIWRDFMKQPAQITKEQMEQIDERYGGKDERFWRRAALASLSMSAVELQKSFGASREVAEYCAGLSVMAQETAGRLRGLAEMMDTAALRLSLVLCEREDMEELLAAAKARTLPLFAEAAQP